jgi:hypothetical protein
MRFFNRRGTAGGKEKVRRENPLRYLLLISGCSSVVKKNSLPRQVRC